MKWLVLGPISENHLTANSIIRALKYLNEDVRAIESRDEDPFLIAKKIIILGKEWKPDFILLVEANYLLFDLIEKSHEYKKIFWSFDFDEALQKRISLTAELSDYFFTISPQIARKNSIICEKSFFLPQGADHFLYMPTAKALDENHRFNIVFIGSPKPGRESKLDRLEKFKIQVFGEQWNFCYNFDVNPAVYGNDFNAICNSSKIVLNLTNYSNFPTPPMTFSQRLFMIQATKSFCLSEYTSGLEGFYEIDREIGIFHGEDDVIRYLENDDLRREIAIAGYERTICEHTYLNRMKRMKEILIQS